MESSHLGQEHTTRPTCYCIFGQDGTLEEVHQITNRLGKPPEEMFADRVLPEGAAIGVFKGTDTLASAHAGVLVGVSRLDAGFICVNDSGDLRARAAAHSIAMAEANIITLTKEIEAISITLSMVGQYRSENLQSHFEMVRAERNRLAMIVRREIPPDISIDPKLMLVAGCRFPVEVSHSPQEAAP